MLIKFLGKLFEKLRRFFIISWYNRAWFTSHLENIVYNHIRWQFRGITFFKAEALAFETK